MPAGLRTDPNRQQKRRKQLLPYAYGTACPLCGLTMYEDEALDLDHSTPVALGGGAQPGDRIAHASCNRSAGATLGNQLRGNRASRDW
jgi:hypothetical protein